MVKEKKKDAKKATEKLSTEPSTGVIVEEVTEVAAVETTDIRVEPTTDIDIADLNEEKLEAAAVEKRRSEKLATWKPKTELGKKVKDGSITDIDQVVSSGKPVLEVEIVDNLMPNLDSDLLMIGQSKGKFGGGARRIFKQTQKKTKDGNNPSFATMAVVGNRDGYVGVGYAKAKETVPAREKALRRAKLNLFRIKRGSGSWLSSSRETHSIPFKVSGKAGSVTLTLMPAPVGKGLVIERECKKVLELAGIKDVWSKVSGKPRSKLNLVIACVNALQQLNQYKVSSKKERELGIVAGNKRHQ